MHDNSHVYLHDNSHVYLHHNSYLYLHDNSHVYLHNNSQVFRRVAHLKNFIFGSFEINAYLFVCYLFLIVLVFI